MKPSPHINKETQQTIQNIQTKQFHFIKLVTTKKRMHMQQNKTIIAKVIKIKFKTTVKKLSTNITKQNIQATSKLTKSN